MLDDSYAQKAMTLNKLVDLLNEKQGLPSWILHLISMWKWNCQALCITLKVGLLVCLKLHFEKLIGKFQHARKVSWFVDYTSLPSQGKYDEVLNTIRKCTNFVWILHRRLYESFHASHQAKIRNFIPSTHFLCICLQLYHPSHPNATYFS